MTNRKMSKFIVGFLILPVLNFCDCSIYYGPYPFTFSRQPTTENRDVVIIGAGAAGLSAAARLWHAHRIDDFTILEAKQRIGGRVLTARDMGRHGEFLEIGAEFIHGEVRNSVFQFAKKNGMIAPRQGPESTIFYDMNGARVSTRDVYDIERLYRQLRREAQFDRNPEISIGVAVRDKFEKWIKRHEQNAPLKRALFRYFYLQEELSTSDDLVNLSIDQDLNYVDASGFKQHLTQNGIESVLEHLVGYVPLNQSRRLQFNAVVRKIDWNYKGQSGRPVAVELVDGRIICAKYVIVTLPLGVLKSRQVVFYPELPGTKLQAINNLGFGCLNKVFLIFERPWWGINSQLKVLFVDNIPDGIRVAYQYYDITNSTWFRNIVAFRTVYGHPLALEVEVAGKWGLVVEMLPVAEVSNVLDQVLRQAFARQYDVETPTAILKSNWCYDPHILGGVSYVTPQSRQLHFDILAGPLPPAPGHSRLFFAGEATSHTQWGSVQGAWDSGIRAADGVASSIFYRSRY